MTEMLSADYVVRQLTKPVSVDYLDGFTSFFLHFVTNGFTYLDWFHQALAINF